MSRTDGSVLAHAAGGVRRSPGWLVGVDAARGLALIGLMSVCILSSDDGERPGSSWSYLFVSGTSAALFALLVGVGLALSSGGRFPHTGRWMAADRAGVAVRAVLIVVTGLGIGALLPEDAPADNILIYYGVFFLLAIPFLHLSATALFVCALLFWIVGPLLMQALGGVLPAYTSSDPTFAQVVGEPGGRISPLLLTGTHPALPYLIYLLVGLGLGRVRLRDTGIQVRLVAVGAGLVVLAETASGFLRYGLGRHGRLLETGAMSQEALVGGLVGGPDSPPAGTAWWLTSAAAHTDTPAAIAAGLGVGLLVLGVVLLLSEKFEAWSVPLAAMGAMALTLCTAHLVALSFELHHDRPYSWYVLHLGTAALFAVGWQRARGQGPLERVVGAGVQTTRRTVLRRPHRPDRT